MSDSPPRPASDPASTATPNAARRVLLFDGVCNMCNASVNWIIDHDPKGRVHFASLQSEAGQALLAEHGLPADYLNSIVLIERRSGKPDRVSVHSGAALRTAVALGWPWKLAGVLLVLPRCVRDAGYGFIAKRRYSWFGKTEACRMPTPELRARFL